MRRKKLKKKHEMYDLTVDNTMNRLQHVGKSKYDNLFNTHADTHLQRVSYIINGWYITINVFLPFFLFLRLSLNWERKRVYNSVMGETVLMFTYLFDGFLRRVFSLLRADGILYIHNALALRHRSFLSKILSTFFTRSLGPRYAPSVHNDISLQNWFFSYFRWRQKGAISALGF